MELISGESVVDNWNSSKVEAIVLILKGSLAVLYLKCLLTPGKDRILYSQPSGSFVIPCFYISVHLNNTLVYDYYIY